MHLSLPLRGIANQRSSAGADLSLFVIFCHINSIAGNNVVEMLEILEIFFNRNNYSSYHHANFVAKHISMT